MTNALNTPDPVVVTNDALRELAKELIVERNRWRSITSDKVSLTLPVAELQKKGIDIKKINELGTVLHDMMPGANVKISNPYMGVDVNRVGIDNPEPTIAISADYRGYQAAFSKMAHGCDL